MVTGAAVLSAIVALAGLLAGCASVLVLEPAAMFRRWSRAGDRPCAAGLRR